MPRDLFVQVTDELLEHGITLEAIAEAVGASYASIRAARLPQASPSYRRPPQGWEEPVAELARKRGGALQELAERLREGE